MRRPGIDFSDIPEVSPTQLRAMRRVGRPPLGAAARRLIAIRIDPQVLDAVRREGQAAWAWLPVPHQRSPRGPCPPSAECLNPPNVLQAELDRFTDVVQRSVDRVLSFAKTTSGAKSLICQV
jgi:hypothetical protein